MSEILEKAKELVDDIYKAMTKVETCETLSEEVASQEVVLVKAGGDRYVKLDGVMTEEQIQDVKKYIQNTIDGNKAEAEHFLRMVSGKAAVVNPDFEAAVQEMISQDQTVEAVTETAEPVEEDREEPETESPEEKTAPDLTPDLTIKAVREVYTEGDMSIKQAAEYFGVGQSKLYSFISEHGLRKPKKDNTPWRTSSYK